MEGQSTIAPLFGLIKSAIVVVENRKTWGDPHCESISGHEIPVP